MDFLKVSCSNEVQCFGNPISLSESLIEGLMIFILGKIIAGGEGIPNVEPPFNGGIESTASPDDLNPSVQ